MGRKRKKLADYSEPRSDGAPAHKKQRPANGSSFNGGHPQVLPKSSVPASLPALPEILPEYRKAVFTHASIAAQRPDDKTMVNYERLEFLGDSYLELMASELIFERYSSAAPGKMSALRELLTTNVTWAEYTQAYKLDKQLTHALHNEPFKENFRKIAADLFEAYVAAVVLSSKDKHKGYDKAKAWMTELWEPKLAEMGMAIMEHNIVSKEELCKMVLVPGVKLNYTEEKPPLVDKVHGKQTYFMAVYLQGWGYDNFKLGSGSGDSKMAASQSAAKQAIQNPKMADVKAKRLKFLEEREKAKEAKEAEAAKLAKQENGEESGEDGEIAG